MKWLPFKLSRRNWFWAACGSLAMGLVGGIFIWEALGNPMPKAWHVKVTSATDGIWSSDGWIGKFEKWRHERVIDRWETRTKGLELGGTYWTTENRKALFYFSADGIFRCWWEYSDTIFSERRTKIDGTKYEFDGSKGYAGTDGERTFARNAGLSLKRNGEPVIETRLGFNGHYAFLILRDPPYTTEFRLWRTSPEDSDFPSHLKDAP